MQLENKVALITGAGSGIGKGAALRMAQAGAKIGVLDTTFEATQRTVAEIQDAGGKALALVADISQPDSMQRVMDDIASQYGRLDIVFANAGINGVWAPLDEITPDEWDRTMAINLRGTFLTVKHALPLLKKQGGAIVVTSSVNGSHNFSLTGSTAYSCSKAAQVAFVKMTAPELALDKIRINVICPGAVSTNINASTDDRHTDRIRVPISVHQGGMLLTEGKPGTPAQIAELVLFLASDAASLITGAEICIDGGASLLIG